MPAKIDAEITMSIRVTDAQKSFLEREGKRLDRPVAWIVRKLIEQGMAGEQPKRKRPAPPPRGEGAHLPGM